MSQKQDDPKLEDISLDPKAGDRPMIEGDSPRRMGRMGIIVIIIILALALGVALMLATGYASLAR